MDLTPAITQEGMKDPMAGHEVVPIDVDKLLNGQKEWSERYDALLKNSDQAG
jgi:iron(III) transport system substrate-binding protein